MFRKDRQAIPATSRLSRYIAVSLLLFHYCPGIVFAADWGRYPGTGAGEVYADKQFKKKKTTATKDTAEIGRSGWIIEPEITVRETLTDNLRLAPDGAEESDFITAITPGISINRRTRRLDFELNFNQQNLVYKNNSGLNDNFNLLLVNGSGELIEDHFFLDISVKNSQQNVSRTGNVALDNISQSGDRASVLTYSVTPYWKQRLGNFMNLEARYLFDKVSSDQAFNSDSEQITLTATSGSDFTRLLWNIKFDDETIDNDTGTSTEFRTVVADLEYLLTRKVALKGTLGYDDNEFTSSDQDITGTRWGVGGVWRPSTRTSLEATIGRRFFGTDISVDASHRSRRTEWQFSYSQVPDTTRSTLLQQQVFTDADIFGRPIDPVTGEQALLNVTNPAQTTEVLIRERFNGAVNYTLRKNIFNLTMFNETRSFEVSSSEETSRGVEFSWEWLIGPKMSSNLSITWSESEFIGGADQEYYITDYRLTRSIGKTLEANVGFRRVDSLSNNPLAEYTEHRIFAGIYKAF